tara:strand:+ start:5215 stop:7713 length:2499 start_codon:yes stop_codon:yes gene_type:complete
MPRPIVEVLQSVANIQTTVTDPTQATLIVGPNYNVINYDTSDTQAVRDLAKVVDFEPYDDGHTTWGVDHVVYLTDRTNIDESSIKIYLEDAEYEVGENSEKEVGSTYNGNASTWADMGTNYSQWSTQLIHDSSFVDSSKSYPPRAGDTLVVSYQMANVFVPGVDFDAAQLTLLGTEGNYVKITCANADAVDTKVYHNYAKLGMTGGFSSNHLDLYEVHTEGEVFSHLADDGSLEVVADSAATIKIFNSLHVLQDTIVGKLVIPEEQVTALKVSPSGSTLTTTESLRQFVSSHLADSVQRISCRIQRRIVEDFPDVTSIEIGKSSSDDWTYAAETANSEAKITFGSAVTVRDTNMPNASALDDLPIVYGKMYVESRDLNITSANSVFTVNSNNLASQLGKISSRNPLGLAASIALQNSGTSNISVMRIQSDDTTGYDAARQYINANPNVYSILPLTQDLSIINTYVTDAFNQSDRKVGKFRVVLGSAESAPLWRYWAGTRNSEYGWQESNLATGTINHANWPQDDDSITAVIQDPEGGFLAVNGPAVGDILVFADSVSGDQYTCTVDSIETGSSLTVSLPSRSAGGQIDARVNSSIYYVGKKDIKDLRESQVEDLIATLTPLTSNADIAKRLVMVYPGEVSVGSESGLPGYYLTAALGGMLAAFEPHRPKNQIAISGIADIEYSNLGYFTDSQIDQLSDSGYFVFIQETPGGLPFCVHQVTAAYRNYASTQEYSELSVVNNFDYISSVFKNTLTPYVGVWNIIPQAYSSIMASLDSAILSLRSRSQDRIGPPLITGEVVSVEQDAADSGTINVVMDVQLPKVLNRIVLEIVSQ